MAAASQFWLSSRVDLRNLRQGRQYGLALLIYHARRPLPRNGFHSRSRLQVARVAQVAGLMRTYHGSC